MKNDRFFLFVIIVVNYKTFSHTTVHNYVAKKTIQRAWVLELPDIGLCNHC